MQQVSDTGHPIFLFRVEAGQSCVVTTACLLSYDDLIAGSKRFRDFVFPAFSMCMTDLFLMIDEVALQRVDVQLADKLIMLLSEADKVPTMHQKLSVKLGTAREVISRQL